MTPDLQSQRRREAWEMAQAPRTMAELLAGVPDLTSRDVRKMVDRRELARVGGRYKAVTPTPRPWCWQICLWPHSGRG